MELYIHIPFCMKKCRYCDFVSFEGMQPHTDHYITTLLMEACQQRSKAPEPMDTVYLGGGTPSLLKPEQLRKLIDGIRSIFDISRNAEITVEANPGTITPRWLDTAVSLGINRISLGMQAAQDQLLQRLGRIHHRHDVDQAVQEARKAGFRNISLDLMFGIPGQSLDDWQETLQYALSMNVEHISAYGLIPEENTPLNEDLLSGRLSLPDPEDERSMYDVLKQTMHAHGFEQYEISNFSLPGFACRHNIGYWRQIPYLGLGLSAASLLNLKREADGLHYMRTKNPDTFRQYDHLVLEHAYEERESESILPAEARFETVMLGLRMTRGISKSEFLRLHGVSLESLYGQKLHYFQKHDLIRETNDRWFLTSRGMDIQNAILVEMMEEGQG